MNTPEIIQYIHEYSQLFWYTPEQEKENISHELLVETILNYGDMEAVKKLFEVMGLQNVASIFFNMQGRMKLNFYPEIYNYFSLFFRRTVGS